jgi:uncharacterized cupin superfamily protein
MVRQAGQGDSVPLTGYDEFEAETYFPMLGIAIRVVGPGEPTGTYQWETEQEDFLVLSGECLLIVEGRERRLRQWDFVHCPPGTAHTFVGAGDGPCVLLMFGARPAGKTFVYPRLALALARGAGVEEETESPTEAYAPFPHRRPGRPERDAELPWSL